MYIRQLFMFFFSRQTTFQQCKQQNQNNFGSYIFIQSSRYKTCARNKYMDKFVNKISPFWQTKFVAVHQWENNMDPRTLCSPRATLLREYTQLWLWPFIEIWSRSFWTLNSLSFYWIMITFFMHLPVLIIVVIFSLGVITLERPTNKLSLRFREQRGGSCSVEWYGSLFYPSSHLQYRVKAVTKSRTTYCKLQSLYSYGLGLEGKSLQHDTSNKCIYCPNY